MPGGVRLADLDLGGDPRDPARPLAHRAHLELVTGDRGEGRRDALLGHRDLEELAAPLLVGHVVVRVHSAHTVSCPPLTAHQYAPMHTDRVTTVDTAGPTFGSLLRQWRQRRRLSQLDLANDA